MANIAIDARPLANPTDGIARYTFEIASRLVQHDQHCWYLYSHAPIRTPVTSEHVRVASGPLANSIASSQILFPRWARQDNIDVFWSPRHHLPIKLSTKSVVTIHDLCWKDAPQTMPVARRVIEKLLTPRSVAQADALTTISQATLDELLIHWPSLAAKSSVVSPGTQVFKTTNPKPAVRPYILSVGTIEPRKNYAFLLETFGRIKNKIPHDLVVIGRQGWGGLDIDHYAKAEGLSSRVRWFSNPTDEDLAAYYQGADLYVSCSLYEGFNLPILEAISCGTPVLASDLAVHREAAGACARYFKLDVDAAAQAIHEVLTEPAALATLAQNCSSRAAQKTWEQAASQTLEVLLGVLTSDE